MDLTSNAFVCCSYRVDLPWNVGNTDLIGLSSAQDDRTTSVSYDEQFTGWFIRKFEKVSVVACLLGREIAGDGTAHYQGCIWFKQEHFDKNLVKLRQWSKTTLKNKRTQMFPDIMFRTQHYSLALARDRAKLESYVTKDKSVFRWNVPEEHFTSIRQWLTKKEHRKLKKQDFVEDLFKTAEEEQCNSVIAFTKVYFDKVKEHDMFHMMNRNKFHELMFKYSNVLHHQGRGFFSAESYIEMFLGIDVDMDESYYTNKYS